MSGEISLHDAEPNFDLIGLPDAVALPGHSLETG